MNASLETNIVSLAPESIKVGTFPFWKFWKPLLIKAVGEGSDGISLINTPDRPGVVGTFAERTKLSIVPELGEVELVVEVVAFALLLWPKFGGN
jgi:hypothetical protein